MTKLELVDKLNHLDPGACLPLALSELEHLFEGQRERRPMEEILEAFAEEHRCTASLHAHRPGIVEFTKDDVF